MAGIITCKVGAKMRLSAGFGRSRQPRHTRRHKAACLIGGPLAGQFYGSVPGINATLVITMRGQTGCYLNRLWSPL